VYLFTWRSKVTVLLKLGLFCAYISYEPTSVSERALAWRTRITLGAVIGPHPRLWRTLTVSEILTLRDPMAEGQQKEPHKYWKRAWGRVNMSAVPEYRGRCDNSCNGALVKTLAFSWFFKVPIPKLIFDYLRPKKKTFFVDPQKTVDCYRKFVDFHKKKCGFTKIFVDLQGKTVDPQKIEWIHKFKVWIFLGIHNFFLWIHQKNCGSIKQSVYPQKVSEDFFFMDLQIFVDP